MTRILMISATREPFSIADADTGQIGGIETTNIELARQFAARGHEVVLASPTAEETRHDDVLNIPLSRAPDIHAEFVISSNNTAPLRNLPTAGSSALWVHNPLIIERLIRKGQMGSLLTRRPHAVFLSEHSLRATSRLLPFRSRRVIHHGIARVFRESPPTDGSKPIVVWASDPHRGLRETLEIWGSKILPAVPQAEFHIFGPAEAFLGQEAIRFKNQQVHFHGRQPQERIAEIYGKARLMLYPGDERISETFCLAAAEAQCMGLPVITSGVGAMKERVTHGHNGMICRSADETADATIRLLTDDALWKEMHTQALSMRDRLTWENSAKQWEEAFDLALP